LYAADEARLDGRVAEQIKLLEAMLVKGHKQPSAYFQLFFTYQESDPDKAFDYLETTAKLLVHPSIIPGSDPTSVCTLPLGPGTYSNFLATVIRMGTKFIEEHRVVSRHGKQLIREASVLHSFFELFDKISLEDFSTYERSELHFTTGNIFRKMGEHQLAIDSLRLAELAFEGGPDEHHYPALLLICEIMGYQALNNSEDPISKFQEVIQEAQKVRELAIGHQPKVVYRTEILLATMMYNQSMLQLKQGQSPDQVTTRTIYELLASGYEVACGCGDQYEMMRAKRILDTIVVE
jgi:hypothetical protein